MLRSETSSNCEEDHAQTLLGGNIQLSYDKPVMMLTLSQEELTHALSSGINFFEDQNVGYFAGYALKRLSDFHKQVSCVTCDLLKSSIRGKVPEEIPAGDFFIWLKKYQDEKSSLFVPSSDFKEYCRQIILVVTYSMDKYVHMPNILKSLNNIVGKQLPHPNFCTPFMRDATISVIVRTLFHYRLKWHNDSIRNTKKKSERKKKILTHK